jgi:TPR repeat protein
MMSPFTNIVLFSLLIVLLSSVSFADHSDGYNKAIEAFNAGDYQTALHLWSEAAATGEMSAQEMLGAMYATGKGVKIDLAEAAKWYQMAAVQGSSTAQFSLGRLYFEGKGIEKSTERAYAWWLISAANGNTGARSKIKAVFNKMPPEQIERAKQFTFDFLHSITK